MKTGYFVTLLAVSIIVASFTGCAYSPSSPTPAKNSYTYHVTVPSPEQGALHVTLSIQNPDPTDSIRLLAPPVYADNPWLAQTAPNLHNVRITDERDRVIAFNSDSVAVGLYNSLAISFPVSGSRFTIEYTVTFHYIDTGTVPTPYLCNGTGYWQGAYVFLIPYHGTHLADIWRSNYAIIVRYTVDPALSFFGDPLPRAVFRNPYELLFSTCAVNAAVIAEGSAGGQCFRFLQLPRNEPVDPLLAASAKHDFEIILNDITAFFPPITETSISVIFGVNKTGGLEGMYAFTMLHPWDNDPAGWFPMILAHEILHCRIGVRVGDYEDPWWKEGTTTYLGYQVALRNNLSSDYFLNGRLLMNLSNDVGVNTFALGDPEVRKHIFAPVNNCQTLVYDKGAQVSMLLDRRIREISGGNTSLCEILGLFTTQFCGKAFYREEYLSYIYTHSGADVSDLFADYVETVGAIPDSVLAENCAALLRMGAFGDTGATRASASIESPAPVPTKW